MLDHRTRSGHVCHNNSMIVAFLCRSQTYICSFLLYLNIKCGLLCCCFSFKFSVIKKHRTALLLFRELTNRMVCCGYHQDQELKSGDILTTDLVAMSSKSRQFAWQNNIKGRTDRYRCELSGPIQCEAMWLPLPVGKLVQ